MNPWEERFPRLWAFGERVSVLVVGSLFFFLFSILIVTIPAALVGLYAAVAGLIRPVPGETAIRFWNGFRRSFGRAFFLGLINLAAIVLIWFDYQILRSLGTPVAVVGAYSFASLGFVVALVNVYAWPLLAWYPQPLGKLLKRSLLLAGAHPFQALAGLVAPLAVVVLFFALPGPVKSLALFLGPGIGAAGLGAAAWWAMKRYAGPDDEFAS
ncbi:MAG TPA: DUF624 domain-containing protein [Symbiobacteriaceae bacterium]|nr:DUF624 domain-containing protein [Symbiobacteriaceae bacterium]